MTAGSSKSIITGAKVQPTALIVLIGLNVALSAVIGAVTLAGPDDPGMLPELLCVRNSVTALLHHPWTAVTYAFANGSLLQLVFNMLWLYCFGRLFLMQAGSRALAGTYLGAAVCGAIAYVTLYPLPAAEDMPSLLMGSSAAVIAVAVAVAVLMPDTELRLPFFGPVRIKWITGIVVVIFCIGLTSYNAGGNLAHLGGAVAGTAAGLIIRARQRTAGFERRKADEYSRLAAKVRTSGYESLSAGEKRRFFELSAIRRKTLRS